MDSNGPSNRAQRKGMAFLLQQMKSSEVTVEEKADKNDESRKRVMELKESVESKKPKINPWLVTDEQRKSFETTNWDVGNLPTNPIQSVKDSFGFQKTRTSFTLNNNYVRSCKWSSSGKFLLTDSADHRTRVFKLEGEKLNESEMKMVCQGGLIYDQQWHSALDVFASSSNGHPIRLFDSECNNLGTATCLNDYVRVFTSLRFRRVSFRKR